ncbi:MAG TPA: hypothetical protein VFZ98_10350 [Vicinamibacterales bacterium]
MRSIAATSIAVLLIAPGAFAQERGSATSNERQAAANQAIAEKRFAELAARVPFESPVKGAPYSADIIVQSSQTLADGNHISHQETSHVYRDGDGRTRRERTGLMSAVGPKGPIVSTTGLIVSIVDPVAGYSYSLDTEHKIAWRTPIGASQEVLAKIKASMEREARGGSQPESTAENNASAEEAAAKLRAEKAAQTEARGRSGGPAPAGPGGGDAVTKLGRGEVRSFSLSQQPLEHATIDGLPVEGHKTSETIPAGKIGNEQPITVTSEEWTSTDLKVLVLTKHNDPRTGESTYHLTNVVRAEPDPSLFMVPADFTVKDTGIKKNPN